MIAARRTLRGVLIGLLAVVVWLPAVALAHPVARAASPAPPVRIMVVGDSISHGAGGDWTWRYRLARHLTAQGVDADFVGPRDTVFDFVHDTLGSPDYLDPDFDRDHMAMWGGSYRDVGADITAAVQEFRPDVVIDALGHNDLLFYRESALDVGLRFRSFVAGVRAAAPDAAVIALHVPAPGDQVTDYNAVLDQAAADLTTPGAPVVASGSGGRFGADDTWDGTHPSSHGEVRLAASAADALAELGIGAPYPRPLALPPLGPRVPAQVSGTASSRAISLSWMSAPGVTHERVWLRDTTIGATWQRRDEVLGVEGTRTIAGLTNGHVYEVTLQPGRGSLDADDVRSEVVRLRPMPPALTAPVEGVTVTSLDHGLAVTWDPLPDADDYVVWYRGRGFDVDLRSVRTGQHTLTLPDLQAGGEYDVWVEASNVSGSGPASVSYVGVPLGPVLVAPEAPVVAETGPGELLARWSPVAGAARYWLQFRDTTLADWWTVIVPAELNSARIPDLQAGHSYEVRVYAIHQRLIGPVSPTSTTTLSVPATSPAPPAPPAALPAVAGVTLRATGHGRAVSRVVPVAGATAYAVAWVGRRTCRARPSARAFERATRVTIRPRSHTRTKARAVWVRWRAVRGDEAGPTRPRSVRCVVVRTRPHR